MKKVVLVIYSAKFQVKQLRTDFEKKVRNDILIQDKNGVCVEFYNQKDSDPFNISFNKMLKKRTPVSTLFLDCQKEEIEKFMKSIEERVVQNVFFFFNNLSPDIFTDKKATRILSVKDLAKFLTTINCS